MLHVVILIWKMYWEKSEYLLEEYSKKVFLIALETDNIYFIVW